MTARRRKDTRARSIAELVQGATYCRAYGHSWGQPDPKAWEGRGRKTGWAVTMICPVCTTQKHFQLSQRGELTAPRYEYPPGYLASFFIGPEERAVFRLEALGLPVPTLKVLAGGKAS